MTVDAERGEMLSSSQPQKPAGNDNDGYKESERPTSRASSALETLDKFLQLGRVEAKGIQPVPVEERKSTRYWNIFTIWCSMNTNILG